MAGYRRRRTTRRRAPTSRYGTRSRVRRGRSRSTRSATRRYSRSVPRKRTARRSRRASPRRVEHVIVVRQEPATPTLATPQAKAKPQRARFTGGAR